MPDFQIPPLHIEHFLFLPDTLVLPAHISTRDGVELGPYAYSYITAERLLVLPSRLCLKNARPRLLQVFDGGAFLLGRVVDTVRTRGSLSLTRTLILRLNCLPVVSESCAGSS